MDDELSLRGAGTSTDDAIVVLDDDDDCKDGKSNNSGSSSSNNNNVEVDNVIMIDDGDGEEDEADGTPRRQSLFLKGKDSDVETMTRRKRPVDQSDTKGKDEVEVELENDDIDHKKVRVEADVRAGVSTSLKGGQPCTTTEICITATDKEEMIHVDDATTIRNHRRKELNRMACRLDPSQSPIKLFATKQDEELRQRVNLVADNRSSGKNRPQNQNEQQEHWSFHHCWTFREMFGLDRMWGAINGGGIDFVVIGTYLLDLDFLIDEIPELLDVPLVVVVCNHRDTSVTCAEQKWRDHIARRRRNGKDASLVLLERNPRADPGSSANPLPVRMDYGCHHSKFVLVGYRSGRLRIIIHTSNLQWVDVHLKCQGAYIQDFYPKTDDQLSSFVTSDFEEALVKYFESYRYMDTHVWTTSASYQDHHGSGAASVATEATTLVAHLQTYDFSTAVAVLVPSIPGYHSTSWQKGFSCNGSHHGQSPVLGYLKVQKAIAEFGIRESCSIETDASTPTGSKSRMDGTFRNYDCHINDSSNPTIICQFSSIGSLSKPYLDKLATAWCVDSVTGGTTSVYASKTYSSNSTNHKIPHLQPNRTKRHTAASTSRPNHQNLKIIWPTIYEITTSFEGPAGGQSVPGRTKCVGKEFLQPLYHRWDGCHNNSSSTDSRDGVYRKGRHVPHIKTYYEIDNNNDDKEDSMKWFVLTSHNLSKGMVLPERTQIV